MKELYLNVVNGFPINSSISDALRKNWNGVKNFLDRLRAKGVKARDEVIDYLKKAFSWMKQDDAEEAFYQYYFAAASVKPIMSGVLTDYVNGLIGKYPFMDVQPDSGILVLDKTLPDGNHSYLEYDLSKDQIIEATGPYFYDIKPGESLTQEQLDAILIRLNNIESRVRVNSRRGGLDEPRMEFFDFLQTIPSVTTPPKTKNDVHKDDYTGSSDKDEFAAYYYIFQAPDGANYSIEFLVDLLDNTGELWVEDESTGRSLGHFPVDDVLDLGDYEMRLVEDMLSTAIGEGPKNSRASDKTFDSVDRLKDFYKKSKISRSDAISTLIDQFNYDANDAETEVISWGKNYYESTHKVSASLKRQTRYRKFITSKLNAKKSICSEVGDKYFGHVVPDGQPNAGSYAIMDENGNVLGVFPDKEAAEAAGYVNA